MIKKNVTTFVTCHMSSHVTKKSGRETGPQLQVKFSRIAVLLIHQSALTLSLRISLSRRGDISCCRKTEKLGKNNAGTDCYCDWR